LIQIEAKGEEIRKNRKSEYIPLAYRPEEAFKRAVAASLG